MKEKIAHVTVGISNMVELRDAMIVLFEMLRMETGQDRIGYVAGVIGSEGEDKVEANREILRNYTERIRAENDFPIFSATDIFETPGLWERLPETNLEINERRKVFIKFWRELLELGKVTDIFMTPRWEISEGATDEYETSQRLGIEIHIVE